MVARPDSPDAPPTRRSPAGATGAGRGVTTGVVTGVVVVLGVLVATKGPLYRLRIAVADLPPGRDFIDDRSVQATFLLLAAALIAVGWPARHRLWAAARAVVVSQALLIGVIIASTLWSIASRRTLEQGVMMAAGTAGFALVAARISVYRMVLAIWVAMQIGVIASLVARVAGWRLAVDRNGDLAGIYLNRNSLGAVAALGVLASVALALIIGASRRDRRRHEDDADIVNEIPDERRHDERRPEILLGIVIVGGSLDALVWFASGSLTPAFAVIVALVTAGLIAVATAPGPRLDLRRRIAVGASAALVAAAALLVAARAWFTDRLGRSPTLSGRTEIWAEMFAAWQRRPIGGFGFMAVWFDPETRAGLVERRRDVYEAHSGYVEVLVGTGLIGIVAAAAVVIIGVGAVIGCLGRRPDAIRLWVVMAVTFSLAANLGETYIGANLLVWYLFVIATVQARMISATDEAGRPAR